MWGKGLNSLRPYHTSYHIYAIFLTTREALTDEELLEGQGEHWDIENGIPEIFYGIVPWNTSRLTSKLRTLTFSVYHLSIK
jgi:hypothetical protein